MAGLISDLAGKASAGALAAVSANLTQAIVTSQTTLEEQIDSKASTSQLVQAVATRHPLITAEAPLSLSLVQGLQDALSTASTSAVIQDGQLSIAKTSGLQSALDSRATISALNNGLNYKQDQLSTTFQLPRSHVQGLEAALSGKLDSLSDAPDNGNSLIASGSTLRKVLGHDGIDVATNITIAPDDSMSSELRISGTALLEAIANVTTLLATKQDIISNISPLPIDYVFGLGQALTSAVSVADVTGLPEALAGKQSVLSAESSLQLASLQCSLIKASAGQNLNLSDSGGTVLLGLASNAATFLRTVSMPSLDCSGSIMCSSCAVIHGPLYVGGVDVMAAIASAGSISANTQLAVASVTASGDIGARDVIASRNLTVAGASTVKGCRVSGGQGQHGTGASLRVTGTGDLVNNTSALYFWGNSVDTHLFELSWLGFNYFYRANATSAWTQSMGINSSGYWTFYRGHGDASDRSLKGDAQDASTGDCLNMLRQVSAKTYLRLDMPGTGPRLGFIAQDVEAACPSTWSNLVGTTLYAREQGGTGAEIRTLDYARLTAVLWQATRSLLARVEALEARLA